MDDLSEASAIFAQVVFSALHSITTFFVFCTSALVQYHRGVGVHPADQCNRFSTRPLLASRTTISKDW
jgi:hypothetical protein